MHPRPQYSVPHPPPQILEASLPLWSPAQLATSLGHSLAHWDGCTDLWVFAYGSLIWKPEMRVAETRNAKIFGFHRSLCLWSTVNRGTPDCPGLVLALDAGGSCQGVSFRIAAADVRSEFALLWKREMMRGSYRPMWLKTHTPGGAVHALAFVMNRHVPTYAGRLGDVQVIEVLTRACGRCGTSAEYVCRTVAALEERGLCDERLARYRNLLAAYRSADPRTHSS